MSQRCHNRTHSPKQKIFDYRVGTGGQRCLAEILGNALVSTQCWANAATDFEAALHE